MSIADLITSRRLGVPRSELAFARELARQPWMAGCDGILDVGANRGMFSVAMASVYPSIPIHAFEPLPQLQAPLRKRLARFGNVQVHACGLAAAPGQAAMHFSAFHEASSLLPMHDLHAQLFPGSEPTAQVTVPLTTLDDFLAGQPGLARAFLKLDVQGFELEVMRGAEKSLGRLQVLLVEVSFADLYRDGARAEQVMGYLFERGYRPQGFVRPLHVASRIFPVSGDFLFVRTG